MGNSKLKSLSLGGALAPILFTCMTLICAYLRPDYSHITNFISELGATGTPYDKMMNYLGFIPAGLLFVLFSFSLLMLYTKTTLARAGASLILVFGLGMVAAGIYSCDPGCPPDGSPETEIHDMVSAVTFISAILGMVLLGMSFRKSSLFQNLGNLSIISGIVAATLLAVMINSFETRTFTGVWQRLLLLTIFVWTTAVGITMYNKHKV